MKPRRPRSAGPAAPRVPARPALSPLLVAIEKPIYGGAFLARAEGKAIFVPLALPGEQARVQIVEDKRSFATAEVDAILAPAPERILAPCPHFGACGGCQYQHATYEAQVGFKQTILRETLERAGVRPPETVDVLAGNPWAYRNRIRVAFDAEGNPGYRGRRSHGVIPFAECPISAPLLVQTALRAADLFRSLAPSSRPAELALFCDAEEYALLASMFVTTGARVPLAPWCEDLLQQIPELRGVECVEQQAGLPPRTVEQCGETSLFYPAAGFDYRVDRGAFFQVNRWLVDALVERVTAGRSGTLAWDLFAGVGLFARKLAARFERVIAVESAPAATAALAHNLNGADAEAVHSSTLAFLQRARRPKRSGLALPDLIVVDPPRTGLGAQTTALLAEIAAPTLIYVSCDPATLARDLRALLAAGYAIGRVTLADLFPQTLHLETIVELRRS
ncbi:MAG: class I SAM-dependent RNA methyltransferase [Acidobacteriota bacterium]